MKLVVIGPVYPYRGGIAHYTSQLSRALTENGHETHIFSFRRQYPGWLYPGKSDKEPSQPQLQLEAKYTLDPIYPWTWLNTSKAIAKLNPDAVLIQWWTTFWGPAFWGLSRLLRKASLNVIFIIHNVIPHEPFPWDNYIARHVLRLGNAHLVQSTNEEEKLLSLIPGTNPTLSPMPVFNFFPSNNTISKDEAKAQVGLMEDIPLLLFFGIVRPYKGLKHAIESVSILRDNGIIVHLIVVGEFWDNIDTYENQISHLRLGNQVTLVNKYVPDEDVGIFFAAADVFVAPYIDGTQSATVRTAIGFNLPIVVTECVADEILRNSNFVRVVPTGNSKAIAEAIMDLFLLNYSDVHSINQVEESWMEQVIAIEKLVRLDEPNSDNAE